MQLSETQNKLFAILFAAGEPLEAARLGEALGLGGADEGHAFFCGDMAHVVAASPGAAASGGQLPALHPPGLRRGDTPGAGAAPEHPPYPRRPGGAGYHRLQPAGDPRLCGAGAGGGQLLGGHLPGGKGTGGGGRAAGATGAPHLLPHHPGLPAVLRSGEPGGAAGRFRGGGGAPAGGGRPDDPGGYAPGGNGYII